MAVDPTVQVAYITSSTALGLAIVSAVVQQIGRRHKDRQRDPEDDVADVTSLVRVLGEALAREDAMRAQRDKLQRDIAKLRRRDR